MKTIIYLSLALLIGQQSMAQDCETIAPFKEGTVWEIQSYDKKGKATDLMIQKANKVESTDAGKSIEVHQTLKDKKGEVVSEGEYKMQCDNGVFTVSIERMMNSESMAAFQGMDVTVDADNLNFPANMKAGDALNDANMKVSMTGGAAGVPMMSLRIKVFNRKVAAEEEITVGAGTYKCAVITYDVETKTIMKMTTSAKDWYCPGVGVVKSETYSKKGKLMGSQELVKFQN